jgi:phosphoglycerol transferase
MLVVVAGGGQGIRSPKQAKIIGLITCVLQGFNYIYYSFFAVLMLCVAILIAYKRGSGLQQLKFPTLAILVITFSTAVNMAPAIQSWNTNGSPPEMGYKSVAEAEIYGAKIRRMLAFHPDNIVAPLANIGRKDVSANFPNENENTTARLGLYGSFGLLLMIFFTLRRDVTIQQPMSSLVALGLATLLVITVGGFGAVINLLSVPDIRAYNRFSIFLAFFAIVIAGLWLQLHAYKSLELKAIGWRILIVAFIFFSLYDQLLDKKFLIGTQAGDMRRAHEERSIVEHLDLVLPNGASILQLPLTGFPPLMMFNKMESYDHVRPYLWSQHLRWSWPSFSQRHRAWQSKLAALQGEGLIKAAILSGFDAIWIDRFAYVDNGDSLIASLSQGKVKALDTSSDRFAVLDLREEASDLRSKISASEFRQRAYELLGNNVLVEWGRGFYVEEKNSAGKLFRWAQDNAGITLRNSGKSTISACVSFDIASPNEGVVTLNYGDKQSIKIKTASSPKTVNIDFKMSPSEAMVIKFSSDLNVLNAQGDPRKLYFYVMNFIVISAPDSTSCSK